MNDRTPGAEPDRDDVAVLLRLAGRRAPIPLERASRVRDAAHAAWRREVGRRVRRRWSWAGAALAAAIIGIAFLVRWSSTDPTSPASPGLAGPPAIVASIVGDVRRLSGTDANGEDLLRLDDKIPSGSGLETAKDGLVALRLPSGHEIRVGESTVILLSAERTIELRSGRLYVDSASSVAGGPAVTVRTRFGEVSEIGTRFEVRVDDAALRVRLRDGRVSVHATGGDLEIEGGVELTLGANGEVTRQPIPAYGPEWDWLLAVTPVPDFDGKPASAVFEWVARERGWSLAYASATAKRSAETNALHGDFGQFRVDDALEVAAQASRLTYRVEEGMLTVASESRQ